MAKTKKNQQDISNLDDVSKKFRSSAILIKENEELRELLGFQELANRKLESEISAKNKEIEHLKSMLQGSVPIIGGKVERFEQLDEETIAEIQLKKLKTLAEHRELTLEETRKFEIFSKIKKMAKETRPTKPIIPTLPANVDNSKLLQIAEKSISKVVDDGTE